MKLFSTGKWYLAALLNVIFPSVCPVCKKRIFSVQEALCRECFTNINLTLAPFCRYCGKSKGFHDRRCDFCRPEQYSFDRALSVCNYTGTLRKCLHMLKYKRKVRLATELGSLMTRFIQAHLNIREMDIITAVPLHKKRRLERGFNQAEFFARKTSEFSTTPFDFKSLIRVKNTRSQFELTKVERFENMREAFGCKHSQVFTGKSVLLIDDIFTTGATANACAEALKQAGASKVTVVTMAR
ncbi:MAG: ComF family protein [PVC group bacterium]|nr:ComF family protein [PVC group bacterium]